MYTINIRHTHTHNINLLKIVTLTIHKHLLFILRVGNTYNKGVQNLIQMCKNIFKKKL